MTWRLDPPIRVGHRLFAALTKVEVTAHCSGRMVVAMADKRPRTILMLDGDGVIAIDLDGHIHNREEAESTYSEAVARLRAMNTQSSSSDRDQ